MREQYIKPETAILAKSKGFDLEVQYWYLWKNEEEHTNYPTRSHDWRFSNWNLYGLKISAPTQSLLHRWLREIYDMKLYLIWYDDKVTPPRWTVHIDKQYYPCDGSTYESALEDGLVHALNLIK
jgi:hypothetical protein